MSRAPLIELSGGVSCAPPQLPPADPNPAAYLVALGEAWQTALEHADGAAMMLVGTPEAVPASVLRERADSLFTLEFEGAVRRLLSMAPDSMVGEAGKDAGELAEALLKYSSWLGADLPRIVRFQNSHPGVVPVLECRARINDRLVRLRRLAAAIPAPRRTRKWRPPAQEKLWNLLASGPLLGPQLAEAMDSTEDATRALIGRMQKAGDEIANDRDGAGYYRRDLGA